MLFIRPTIMRNTQMNLAASSKRYNDLRSGQLDRYKDGVNLMWEENQPVLAPIDAAGREVAPPPPLEEVKSKPVNNLWFH
jgi:hypothetical protein